MPEPTITVELTRVELAGVLAATNAIASAAPGTPPLPLITAGTKLDAALSTPTKEGDGR
jgi:hypothetical protein